MKQSSLPVAYVLPLAWGVGQTLVSIDPVGNTITILRNGRPIITVVSRRKYAQPPIQEAVCEIHFKLAQPFSNDDFGEDSTSCTSATAPNCLWRQGEK